LLGLLTVVAAVAYADWLGHHGFDISALATVGAVATAALLSGIAGFAFSAICGAMLFHFRQDTVTVVEIMLICSIANQFVSVWTLRRDIRIGALSPFLAGGVIGIPAGVWMLLHLNAGAYVMGLGAILIVYGCYMLVRPPITLRRSPLAGDIAFGFIGGVLGGFAATPGAVVSIWCGMKGWDKVRQRALFQPFILIMQFVTLASIAMLHGRATQSFSVPLVAWASVPAGLVGTWWGLACFRRMTDRQFATAINVLLIVSGAGLVL
jgi:uncharacterized membrane protein YfcA